jgi:hypothetical protein
VEQESVVYVSAQSCVIPVCPTLADFHFQAFPHPRLQSEAILSIVGTHEDTSIQLFDIDDDVQRSQGGGFCILRNHRREARPFTSPIRGLGDKNLLESFVTLIQIPLIYEGNHPKPATIVRPGMFPELANKTGYRRDPRLPIHITIQFYGMTFDGNTNAGHLAILSNWMHAAQQAGASFWEEWANYWGRKSQEAQDNLRNSWERLTINQPSSVHSLLKRDMSWMPTTNR